MTAEAGAGEQTLMKLDPGIPTWHILAMKKNWLFRVYSLQGIMLQSYMEIIS